MLVILLSLIIGFGIANATNKKSLKFILTYSLLSFIIIVFIFQKSCKKCKNKKECIIEKFDKEKEKQKDFKVKLLKFITELKYFSKFLKTNKNKEITQEKINEMCNKIKKSKTLSLVYFNNISKNNNNTNKDIYKGIRDKLINKFKHLDKKDFEKKKKAFLTIMKVSENKQRRKTIQRSKLNMPYINSIIQESTNNLQNYIALKNKKPCQF